MQEVAQKSVRLSSVDALRGLTVAAMLLVNNAGDWDHIFAWLEHSSWHGCTPADFIFPFFLVIVGVSLHLALAPKLLAGVSTSILAKTVVWRGVRIFLLGVLLHLIAQALIPGREFRLLGVLQRIGICFAVVGLIVIYVRQQVEQWVILAGILLGYWGLLLAGGSLEPHLNLADRIDTQLLGHLAYAFDSKTGLAQEPEGILTTLPALASVLLGAQAGAWLRAGQVSRLWAAGAAAILVGALWAFGLPLGLPLNKQLWTSSFVLWTGGFAFLGLAAAHQLIDLKAWPAIGKSFGVNAIVAYGGAWVATCVLAATGWQDRWYGQFFKPVLASRFGDNFSSFAFALMFTLVFAVLLWVMRRKKWIFSI